jgi:hypothetical protein
MVRVRAAGLRLFISYAHVDRAIFDRVVDALRRRGLEPWSDVDFAVGTGFTEQIQTNISHSHLFVPILTRRSHGLGWVHQEIGYAVAMKIPSVPVCVGKVPNGMLAMAHSIVVNDSLDGLDDKLAAIDFEALVERAATDWLPPGETALEPEQRAVLIARHAEKAWQVIGPSCVRIKGRGLTSFSIPDEPPENPVWIARYGGTPRGTYSRQLFRQERQALARHARTAGLRLIVNVGFDFDTHFGVGTKRARLTVLMQFLESLELPEDKVRVAVVQEHSLSQIVAVGDWFVAESLTSVPGRGVLHSVFTAHPPTVNMRIAEFDQSLDRLLREQGITPSTSRTSAIRLMQQLVHDLPSHPAWPRA